MDEEQELIDDYYSENGIRTNLEDGSNDPAAVPRDYSTACAFNEAAFDAYKAAAVAQCQKQTLLLLYQHRVLILLRFNYQGASVTQP